MPRQTANADAITDGRGRAMLSVDDVAQIYLGCSTRHVYRLADSGRMPRPIKLGSLFRWPRAVIEQWIADGCPNVRNAIKGGR
ncbi:MAG: helix-turn-helix transcriptional regulator [Pirellula sp.]